MMMMMMMMEMKKKMMIGATFDFALVSNQSTLELASVATRFVALAMALVILAKELFF
jgi:hypothetical protein